MRGPLKLRRTTTLLHAGERARRKHIELELKNGSRWFPTGDTLE